MLGIGLLKDFVSYIDSSLRARIVEEASKTQHPHKARVDGTYVCIFLFLFFLSIFAYRKYRCRNPSDQSNINIDAKKQQNASLLRLVEHPEETTQQNASILQSVEQPEEIEHDHLGPIGKFECEKEKQE